jgi:hypothetical protein
MIRLLARGALGLALALAAFGLSLWALTASGVGLDPAIVWSMLAAMPWAWALGTWAGMPPRVGLERIYIAPVSTSMPTAVETGKVGDDWR